MPPLSAKEIDDALDDTGPWEGYDEVDDLDESWRPDAPRPMYAVLTMNREVRAVSMEEWVKYFMASPRRIAYTNVSGVVVSTTFLGINLGFDKPLWFETMVFGGGLDGHCERYTMLEEAVSGHQLVVVTIRDAMRDAAKAARTQVERVRRNNIVR